MTEPRTTVLVIDDTEAERYYVTRVLERAGFEVRQGANGADALRMAGEQPDLITLDVRLPDINGFEVCRRLKADPATRDIPVLHISASFTSPESIAEGLEGGADGYLTHPADPAELVATVRALLRARWAEARARQTAREWMTTFDLIDDGVCLTEVGGAVVRCNRAFAGLLDRPFDQIIGRRLDALVPELGPLLHSGAGGAEEVQVGDRHFRVSSGAGPVGEGAMTTRAWILGDVTEQRRIEEQLQQAQRLEAVGRLAGGVAHETNNQMTVVLGCTNFALRHGGMPADLRADIEQIRKAAERTATITAQLLAFGRRQPSNPEVSDLNFVIRRLLPILERAIGPLAFLETELADEPVAARIDAGQLDQVLLNLVMNAGDAMPEGGTLRLRTARTRVPAGGAERFVADQITPGSYVRVSVSDTGTGMDEATLHRAFEPFFTTKGVGQGSGLGLSMVYGIVRQNGGFISVESQPGRGTTVALYFPQAESAAGEPGGAPAAPTHQPARSVLLVEDDSAVRGILARELRAHGYQVLEAANGKAALELVGSHPGPLDAVITDVQMPEVDGQALAAALAGIRPRLPVIFMSGHPDSEATRQLSASGTPFIRKPFTGEELVCLVEGLLART
jgi:DNA-binding response OmpR family regulator/nitrogen-specific signal transduction histidine kinase